MPIETVAYIGESAEQEVSFVCQLVTVAARLGMAIHVAPDPASGFDFLARSSFTPAIAVVLAPGPAQALLAQRVYTLAPSAQIICLNGCSPPLRSALPAQARHTIIDPASPSLTALLVSALTGGRGEAVPGGISDPPAAYNAITPYGDGQLSPEAVVLDSMPALVAYADGNQHLRFANRRFEELFESAPGEARGRHLREALGRNLYAQVQGCIEAVLRGEEAAHASRLRRTDGSPRVLCATFLRHCDETGHLRGMVCFLLDVTQQQRLQQHLLNAQRLQSMKRLAAGLAHDFNNLLTVILGNVSLAALQLHDGPRLHENLIEAQEAVARGRRLTRELLTFSCAPDPARTPGSIAGLLRETTTATLQGTSVHAEFVVDEDLWQIEFDAKLIGVAFSNLMLNAVHAMPLGGVLRVIARNVWLSADSGSHRKRPYVKISIIDSGVGIPQEHLSRIFDPYFTTKQSGSGFGLAIAYAVIERHGGIMEVESKVGVGTCVCVHLPRPAAGNMSKREADSGGCDGVSHGAIPPACENLAMTAVAATGNEAEAVKSQGDT